MNENLREIHEVRDGGVRLANWYLSKGYVLLDIQSASRARNFDSPNPGGARSYVHKNPVYVVGCPEGTPPAGDPPRGEPPAPPAATKE